MGYWPILTSLRRLDLEKYFILKLTTTAVSASVTFYILSFVPIGDKEVTGLMVSISCQSKGMLCVSMTEIL